ncbi:MAG TPA: cation:proton antiporter [Candidatus Eisenbacteria bacterium]|nr:cation:proton antiporter [Candidatus Eisenbacteria bacterium]
MTENTFLQDLVITLTAALLVLLPSRRLKIPTAVGFMITGILIGPGALELIGNPHHVETLAEIGVAVLLFMIGLEFSLARLKEIGRAFLVAGPLQVIVTMAVVAAILLALPIAATLPRAIFAGMLVTLSSTAMLLRMLIERGEMHAPQGRLILGVLLFQDFAIIPMLILIPALAGNQSIAMGPRLLTGLVLALAFLLAARFLMPRIVNAVIRSGVRELYVMMAVAVCLGAALLTQSLGLSPALGAFLAGLLVSESEYSHQIVAEILPFRDLFSSLFFISIGMLLAPDYLFGNLPTVGGWFLLTIAVKAVVAAAIVRAMGYPLRIAAIVGISLAQVGEFSFVLISVGTDQGLVSASQSQQFLAVAVLTLIATPYLMRFASWVGAHTGRPVSLPGAGESLEGHVSGAGLPLVHAPERLSNHVVIAGYGVNGRNVARVLNELGINYVVMELDTAIIRRAKEAGEKIQFGDVSRPEGLHACAVDRASVVVLAISDPGATRFAVAQVRGANPRVYVIARTRQVAEVAELMRLGADEVIPEEFETSIAIVMRVLRRFHVPGNVIRFQEQALRREGYSFLRGGDVAGALMHSIERMMAGAITDTYYIDPESPSIGRTLADLDVRGRTRALIIAVVRDGTHELSPGADFRLKARDVLVMVGDHQALEAASHLLEGDGRAG